MPHISSEDVKTRRNLIRKEFPRFKFSITRGHYSSINVDILEAPFNMLTNKDGRTYEQVNHYYIGEHYKDFPQVKEVLEKIYSIMSSGNHIIAEDGDYGSIPAFYTNISIGTWEKPVKVV